MLTVLAVVCYFYVLDNDSKKISRCQSRWQRYWVYDVLRSELEECNRLMQAMLILGTPLAILPGVLVYDNT